MGERVRVYRFWGGHREVEYMKALVGVGWEGRGEEIGYMYFWEVIGKRSLKASVGEAIQKWNT